MKSVLKIEDLRNKQFLRDSNILKISFEYSLAKIFKEYFDYKQVKDIVSFNNENRFSIEKLLIYPFFISTSNGHSKFLFELFGDFYAPNIGPVSLEIIKYFFVDKKESTFFKFNEAHVEVLNTNFKNWDDILTSILDQHVEINSEKFNFRNIFIARDDSTENELYKGIDSGIKILKEQSGNRFFVFNEYDLKYHSHNYDAFTTKVKSNGKIDYNDIIKDKDKLPFYAN